MVAVMVIVMGLDFLLEPVMGVATATGYSALSAYKVACKQAHDNIDEPFQQERKVIVAHYIESAVTRTAVLEY